MGFISVSKQKIVIKMGFGVTELFTSCDNEKLVMLHVSVFTDKSRRTSIILSVDIPCQNSNLVHIREKE